jgi:hypothetical protein
MARHALSDPIWEQLQVTMKAKGCHRWPNDREVVEAILWKLRTGAPWRDVPREFCPWKTAYNRFNRWAAKGLWADFFLSYEAKLIRSGYSPMEVTSALISMRVELGVEKNALLENPVEELPPSFMLPPMRMEIRSILKSLGVKSTTPKLRINSLQK